MALTKCETWVIITIAIIAISTKLIYAFLAEKVGLLFANTGFVKGINYLAGSLVICVGLFLIFST